MRSTIITCLFLFTATLSLSQKTVYPAMVALSRPLGFMLDSAETAQSNLFPAVNKNELNYLVLIANDPVKYSVKAVYKNGDVTTFQYSSETIKKEWNKISTEVLDSTEIKDYKTAKLYFPEVASFATITAGFVVEPYVIKNHSKNALFIDLGISGSEILGGVLLPSYSLAGNVVVNKMLFSLNFQNGKSGYTNELVQDSLSRKYKYSDLGISAGYILNKNILFLAVTGGVSYVKYTELTYYTYYTYYGSNLGSVPVLVSWMGGPNTKKNSVELESKSQTAIGFPIGLHISVPAASAVGICLKTNVTFVVDQKPTFNFGVGIRFGRTNRL
jgi:putative flippase GtrA